ncbi:MAG: hypothetical protein RL481_1311 [Pseudomonadota bacterium]
MGVDNPQDSAAHADADVRAAEALRDDLLAVLFPRCGALPSEYVQSAVRLKIQMVVQGIERQLTNRDGPPQSWDALSASGLLREPSLVEFALARLAEEKLKFNLEAGGATQALSQLPVLLLGHENPRIAVMARQLLSADRSTASMGELYRRLPNSDLHLLCWRVVAAVHDVEGCDVDAVTSKATELLAGHNGDSDPVQLARKLVFFLGPDHRATLIDPRKAGLHLFIAAMAQEYRLESDLLYRLIAGDSPFALLLLLRGQGLPVEQLPSLLVALRGGHDSSPDIADAYTNIDPIEARAAISAWVEQSP